MGRKEGESSPQEMSTFTDSSNSLIVQQPLILHPVLCWAELGTEL